MATKYPNEIQTFPTMQDITAEDAVAVIAYQKAMQDGDINAAQVALSGVSNYNTKIITADLINTILDTCTEVQKYYTTRYSPAYIVSSTQPTTQQPTDFWFEVTA